MRCAGNREPGAMSESPQHFATRKQLLLAQAQLQRMQLSLYVDDARDALRPAGVIGSAVARPAALGRTGRSQAPLATNADGAVIGRPGLLQRRNAAANPSSTTFITRG